MASLSFRALRRCRRLASAPGAAKETFRFRIRIRIANFNGNFKEGGLFVQLKEKVKTVIGLYITTQPTDRPQILKRLSKDQ